mgnify:FL=1
MINFPVYVQLFGKNIHPHVFFETLAYFVAARIYSVERRKLDNNYEITFIQKISIIYGMIFGAFIFAILISYLQNPIENIYKTGKNPLYILTVGKTIVGGIFGAILGIEITKKIVHVDVSTGDAFVLPIIIGMMIGRLGCFLTGLSDGTVGNPTKSVFGIDFGDGITRHPTQLYEIVFFIIILALYLKFNKEIKKSFPNGFLFKTLIVLYFIFRFVIDYIKPYSKFYFGLNSIQVICLITIVYYGYSIFKAINAKIKRWKYVR